jgi:uncharacterized C2H2 Zn-finger protein
MYTGYSICGAVVVKDKEMAHKCPKCQEDYLVLCQNVTEVWDYTGDDPYDPELVELLSSYPVKEASDTRQQPYWFECSRCHSIFGMKDLSLRVGVAKGNTNDM